MSLYPNVDNVVKTMNNNLAMLMADCNRSLYQIPISLCKRYVKMADIMFFEENENFRSYIIDS
jgi:hypothetical protein